MLGSEEKILGGVKKLLEGGKIAIIYIGKPLGDQKNEKNLLGCEKTFW